MRRCSLRPSRVGSSRPGTRCCARSGAGRGPRTVATGRRGDRRGHVVCPRREDGAGRARTRQAGDDHRARRLEFDRVDGRRRPHDEFRDARRHREPDGARTGRQPSKRIASDGAAASERRARPQCRGRLLQHAPGSGAHAVVALAFVSARHRRPRLRGDRRRQRLRPRTATRRGVRPQLRPGVPLPRSRRGRAAVAHGCAEPWRRHRPRREHRVHDRRRARADARRPAASV